MIISSCATERVIYKTEYIKPNILPLRIFQRPKNDKVCSYNVDNLTSLVEAYEIEIIEFNDSLKELDKQ